MTHAFSFPPPSLSRLAAVARAAASFEPRSSVARSWRTSQRSMIDPASTMLPPLSPLALLAVTVPPTVAVSDQPSVVDTDIRCLSPHVKDTTRLIAGVCRQVQREVR